MKVSYAKDKTLGKVIVTCQHPEAGYSIEEYMTFKQFRSFLDQLKRQLKKGKQ